MLYTSFFSVYFGNFEIDSTFDSCIVHSQYLIIKPQSRSIYFTDQFLKLKG